MSGLSREGTDRARRWYDLQRRLRQKEKEIDAMREELNLAGDELGKFLMPLNMVTGEKICSWVRIDDHYDKIVEVEKFSDNSYFVRLRD
jgi:hypothetical protein